MLGDSIVSMEVVAGHILKEIRESVSLQLKKEVNRAVITCPAYFQERQRQAVRTAGEQAGFHVERILAEPTAAALNYGFGRSLERRKILIYDLGGGTFDCSLMEIDGDVYDVMATGGDSFLGGLDFDDRLARLLIKEIRAKYGIDPREDETALDRILQAAERAKRDLSDHNSTVVRLDYFVIKDSSPQTIELKIERVIAEKYWDSLVERTLAVVEDVCARSNLAPMEVDDVILVGGQSRSPIVRRKVRELFGKEPRREVHPDEAVALGAAQYGNSLGTFDSLVLIDALPMSIGVGLPGGRFKKIIERDTKLPVSKSYTIRTTHDDQISLKVVVFQGEQDSVVENDLVGTLKVLDVPANAKGAESVEVTFEMTGEGLLNLRAKILSSGREVATKLYTKATPVEVREALNIPPPNPKDAVGGTGAVVVAERPKSKGVGGWIKSLFNG
jgi:molecular chaperone DnaK